MRILIAICFLLSFFITVDASNPDDNWNNADFAVIDGNVSLSMYKTKHVDELIISITPVTADVNSTIENYIVRSGYSFYVVRNVFKQNIEYHIETTTNSLQKKSFVKKIYDLLILHHFNNDADDFAKMQPIIYSDTDDFDKMYSIINNNKESYTTDFQQLIRLMVDHIKKLDESKIVCNWEGYKQVIVESSWRHMHIKCENGLVAAFSH